MNRFIHHIPAVDGGQGLQDFEIEQRDAAGRPERLGSILRRFLNWIEQHRLDPRLLLVSRNDGPKANRITYIQRELAPFTPRLLNNLLDRATGSQRFVP